MIRPSIGWRSLDLGEVWRYRELLYFLTRRDISVRYKQTALGAAWAVLQPVLLMVVFTAVFGTLARIPSDGLPYPLFAFAALLPWQLFSFALTEASNSLVGNQRLITKVYFPRLVIPLASTLPAVVDFGIAFVVLLALMTWFAVVPTVAVVALPIFVGLALMTSLGVGIWLSALNVEYRDVRYTLPFLTQLWFFATPIVYPASLLPEPWRTLLGLNPMAGVVEGFRWALLGTAAPAAGLIAASAIVALVVLLTGTLYFRRVERGFADVI